MQHPLFLPWLSRRNKIRDEGITDPKNMLKILITTRLRVEYAFFMLTHNLDGFSELWGQDDVLCSLSKEESLVLK